MAHLILIGKLNCELRFDLEITRALSDKRISFGDFVSHLIPIRGIENIAGTLETLLGESLREVLKNVREFVEPPDHVLMGDEEGEALESTGNGEQETVEPPALIVPDVEKLMASISQLFKARHVAAHEADFDSVSYDDIQAYFDSANLFITALEEYIDQTLNPGDSRNAFGMSLIAARKAGEAYTEMEETYQQLFDVLNDENEDGITPATKALKDAQDAFLAYLQAE